MHEKYKNTIEFITSHLSSKKRLAGDSYSDHALRVFNELTKYGVTDDNILHASLLHDVETGYLEEYASNEVVGIFNKYNILKKFTVNLEKESNETYAIQTYINNASDINVLVLRMFDRLDNIKTLYALDESLKISSAKRALAFYAPLSKLLGFGKLSTEIEDTAFMHLYPDEFFKISSYLSGLKAHAMPTLHDALDFISSLLNEQGISCDISTRFKGCYSTYKKLDKYGELHDIIAARIVVDSIETCYQVESLLHKVWDSHGELRDDYIQTPRPLGYQSLHNIFKLASDINLEIQIRTKEMHEFNEYGPAAHLLYKIGDKGANSNTYKKFLSYTRQNTYWFKDLSFFELAKKDATPLPFSEYVYAFTPKGDIIQLPKGACLIDFAYAVHTDIGNKCTGGYVNNKYVPLRYVVNTGDFIRVETGKKINANTDWLSFVKTTKARGDIKKVLSS